MRVYLPAQFRAESLYGSMQRHFPRFSELPNDVILDFSNLRFVRPSGVVFLSNLTRFLLRSNVCVTYDGIEPYNGSICFLDDAQFFRQHLGRCLREGRRPRATTVPLRQVANTESHGWLQTTFIPWLSECTDRSESSLSEIRVCISEIFNNISDHTELDVGSIFAQWYPNEKCLEIAIADFGQGIPNNVRRVISDCSDSDAIVKAAEDGFSSKSIPTNRGAGLFYLIQNVVERLGGVVSIWSGRGAVRFENVNGCATYTTSEHPGMCPGTMIELVVRTDLIEATSDDPEEFEW